MGKNRVQILLALLVVGALIWRPFELLGERVGFAILSNSGLVEQPKEKVYGDPRVDSERGWVVGEKVSPSLPWRWEQMDYKTTSLLPEEVNAIPLSNTQRTCKIAYRSQAEAAKGMILPGQCCPGAISNGGSNVPTKGSVCAADKGVNYFLNFKIKDGESAERPPQSLADGLRLLPNGTRIVIVGDSVQNQFFNSAACSLGRDSAVSALRSRVVRKCSPPKGWSHGLQSYESVLVLLEPGHEVEVLFFRMYQPVPPQAGVVTAPEFEQICSLADVLVVNFGLHFNQAPEIQSKDYIMKSVVACKRELGVKIVIWRESLAQHFQYAGGNFRDRGTNFSAKVRQMQPSDGCSELRFGDKEAERNWRDRTFLEQAKSFNVTVVETEWNKKSAKYSSISAPSDRIHWVSSYGPSEPLWAMHRTGWTHVFNGTAKRKSYDCTHFCYTPDVIFAPLIDGISLALFYERHQTWEPRRADLDNFQIALEYCPNLQPPRPGI